MSNLGRPITVSFFELSALISFFGNYVTNTVIAAVVALVPAAATPGVFTAQYISYVVLAAIVVALLAKWDRVRNLQDGLTFGAVGFVVALLTAFVTGISGVLTQTGSLSQMVQVIPNFWPFIASWSTLALLLYWMIPAAAVGWWKGRAAAPAPMM